MNPRPLFFLPAILLLLLPAGCGDSGRPKRQQGPDPTVSISRTEGAQVQEKAPPKPDIGPPPAGHVQYIVDVQDDQGRPVGAVDIRVLTGKPEGLYMREPRRRDVEMTYSSPLHGRVFFNVPADGQPRWLWVGGLGITPFLVDLEAPTPAGSVFRHQVTVKPVPVCRLVIQDHRGWLVADAIVSMTPPGAASHVGMTRRSDAAGEVTFTLPHGTYELIATKADGTCRYTDSKFEWKGQDGPVVIRLPERTGG